MASMNEKDYYAILEVDEKATTEEIRRAFQKKARKLHPDVNKEPDAEDRFKEVSEAYAVLSDADKRSRYDQMRQGGIPFTGGYPGGTAGYGGSYGDYSTGFPFGGSWSRRQTTSRSYRPRAGADIQYSLELDAETARGGVRRGVTYQRYATCDVCHGSGSVEHAHATTCPTCGGAGRMKIDLGGLGLFGVGYMEVTCPECEGSGKVVVDPCSACGGSGRVLTASEIVIDIPADSHDGTEVRVEGMGNAGTNGREAGDFVCQVLVAEERLSPMQQSALRTVGFGLPFVIIGSITKGLSALTIIGVIICAVGLAMVFREGIHLNGRWMRAAGAGIVGGACTGVIIGLLLLFSGPLLTMMLPIALFVMFISLMSRGVR